MLQYTDEWIMPAEKTDCWIGFCTGRRGQLSLDGPTGNI